MSKPGGRPIVKQRPMFQDDQLEVGGVLENGKITGFYLVVKETNERKEFKVVNDEITKAWQQLENYGDPIAAKLLRNPKLTFKKREVLNRR
jgi:hypothetical protein